MSIKFNNIKPIPIIISRIKFMLKLYDLCGKNNLRFSPACWNIKLCLIFKGIPFETVPVRFSEKHKIAFSNQDLVPIITHKDGFVCDSWNIITWLDKNYTDKPLFINSANKNFSHFLYYWTSKQLLPELFKIIANDIPNILDKEDLEYYIKTRETRIKGPLSQFKPFISSTIKNFRKLISPIRTLIKENGYISGNAPGLEDFIFIGNFKWVAMCSNCDLLDNDDCITDWYNNLHKTFSLRNY
jgi:glutathione S-transferase